MRWRLVAIGQKMPDWVEQGWSEYARRFPRGYTLEINQIPAIKRTRNADIAGIRQREGEALLSALSSNERVIALNEKARQWSTIGLAAQMQDWMQQGQDVAFLVGGPDGLSQGCLDRADQVWSLSKLTFPHPLVRVILAEQIYRAWTVTQNHPYHRE